MGMEVMKYLMAPTAIVIATGFSTTTVADNGGERVTMELEHVLVSVPKRKAVAETALPVTVLTGNELASRIASTIGETLNNKPGLASASFGPSVGQPVIRGQQGPRVAVLQNSMRSADASALSADHAVSVEPVLAESIEVLRGPSTLLYGGGAIGGVVNVIDKRIPDHVPEQLSGAAEVRHASVNDENVAVVSLDGGDGRLAFHVDAVARDSNNVEIPGLAATEHEEDGHDEENTEGFIANTDSESASYSLGASYMLEQGYIGLAINQLDNQYGIPEGAHQHHDHDDDGFEDEEQPVRIDMEQTRYDLRAELADVASHIEQLRWYLTYTDYQHQELEGAEVGTTWNRESWDNRFELLHREWRGWRGVAGLQLQQSELQAVGEESYLPKTDTSTAGLFMVEDKELGDWTYELGARLDWSEHEPDQQQSASESFSSLSLSAAALWKINDAWNIGLALSRSERAPVVEELYSNAGNELGSYVEHLATSAIEVGNTELDTEKSRNVDLSVTYTQGIFDGYITLFYNDFSDYIYLANTGLTQNETEVLAYRQEGAKFKGLEFELKIDLGPVLGGSLSLDLFGDWLDGELDTAGDVPRLPPHRLGSRLNYQRDGWSSYLSVVDADEQDQPGFNEEETAAYTRWDAGLSYQFDLKNQSQLLCFLRLKNIGDEEIRNSTSFLRDVAPEPGRSVEAGLRYQF
jgi:iron complex outermembrane receptor protein